MQTGSIVMDRISRATSTGSSPTAAWNVAFTRGKLRNGVSRVRIVDGRTDGRCFLANFLYPDRVIDELQPEGNATRNATVNLLLNQVRLIG